MGQLNVQSVQELVDELQGLKRRKSQLIFDLQHVERCESSLVQRLQIELGLAADEPSNVRSPMNPLGQHQAVRINNAVLCRAT